MVAGERLDLSSEPPPRTRSDSAKSGRERRRFLGVRFDCCSVYARIYVNPQGNAYQGNCPRCGHVVRVLIGEGGTDTRFFRVSGY